MTERRIDGFFYGLFMDADVLRNRGVAPADPRHAHVDTERNPDYAVRLQRALRALDFPLEYIDSIA
jgi:hypothetical protein